MDILHHFCLVHIYLCYTIKNIELIPFKLFGIRFQYGIYVSHDGLSMCLIRIFVLNIVLYELSIYKFHFIEQTAGRCD